MSVRYHRYQIEYIEHHEIACPRYTFADGTYVIVVPWFLVPGRPYPLQVYLFACSLYSSCPEMGQRGVAEATRAKFKLETFSHSTVSRSFRSFEEAREQALENKYGRDAGAFGEATPLISAATKGVAKKDSGQQSEVRFRTVADTSLRRDGMRGFLPKFQRTSKTSDIEARSKRFSEIWHKNTRRLLL